MLPFEKAGARIVSYLPEGSAGVSSIRNSCTDCILLAITEFPQLNNHREAEIHGS